MVKSLPLILAIFLFFIHVPAGAQIYGQLSGKVVDRATQKPLSGISVTLEEGLKGTITDSLGLFRFTGLDVRTYYLVFSGIGYTTLPYYNVVVSAGNETNLNVELDPAVESLKEVVIRSIRRTAAATTIESPLSIQRLTTEEIRSNPGGNFDISKVIQALPGVGGGVGGGGFRNDIIIRGGAPNENVFYLDGIEIPVR